MPQMAPMNWFILYIIFSMTFISFNFMNYYIFILNKQTMKSNKFMKKILNWKW
uniref:ATP synthase complex subunit 8 n=1 Tax=Lioporeus pilatei TaxID=2714623 RepID=A0A894JSY1_9DYTI|nr:ATP synthase F0 subunit 8 [Lioporeus pilatei]QRV62754.1 ATP synthase F0 subunit 8 [Lioporeus pilatei]